MSLSKGVSLETGERGILVPCGEGYSITSPTQREAFNKIKAANHRGANHPFTFFNIESLETIQTLDDKYCGYLLMLQTYIDYDGCLILSNQQKPMKRANIAEVLEIKETALRLFLKTMKSNGIITLNHQTGTFIVDSHYHFKGALEKRIGLKAYVRDIRKLYHSVSAKDLGFLYRIMPYIHYRDNILCENPNEPSPYKIISINKLMLAELVGVTRATLDKKIKSLRFGIYQVFAEVHRGDHYQLYINPMILYRHKGYPDTTLLTIFLAK